MMKFTGFRVWDLRFRVWDSRYRVSRFGSWVLVSSVSPLVQYREIERIEVLLGGLVVAGRILTAD